MASTTICALATPPGVAGLAVIRVSGPEAQAACDTFFRGSVRLVDAHDHTILYGWWHEGEERIDSVTCSVFIAPNSYTGEHVVEIGCHGGTHVVHRILQTLHTHGLHPAEPGEFTRRAFLNGKLDLTQVEAVADLIHAQSALGARSAARQLAGGFTRRLQRLRTDLLDLNGLLELELDFSEEDVEFADRSKLTQVLELSISYAHSLADSSRAAAILRSGFSCAVVGYPNAGKSSLFNALLERDRAIVSDIPGTTRDYLEETILAGGFAIRLFDTAGLRDTSDTIELHGIRVTSSLIEQSDLVLIVNDATHGVDHSDDLRAELEQRFPDHSVVVVQNKCDLTSAQRPPDVTVSAHTGEGLLALRDVLVHHAEQAMSPVTDVLVNARQAALLLAVADSLRSARRGIDDHVSNEFIAVDIRTAIRVLGEITGETWSPDVLDTIFSRFCIGK
jgi:tRNA modification GTPase